MTPDPAPSENRKFRFLVTMGIFCALAILASLSLSGVIRTATWIFLGGLALKTWIAYAGKL
jgi:hypothetical protein